MYKNHLRPSVRWGLMAVVVHWTLSVPFFFCGPMLATPSHGGIIGWVSILFGTRFAHSDSLPTEVVLRDMNWRA
jgi:hypothetical protein